MTAPPPPASPGLTSTLQSLLTGQAAALRRRFLWHGVATVLALLAGAVLLFFGLDRWLDLPLPIRLLHTTALLALLVVGGARFVRYPMTRRFADVDLAVWFERTFPDLHQRLVSAVQLQSIDDTGLRNQSRPMIDQLLAEAAREVQRLPLARLFDNRPTLRMAAIAGGLGALLVGGSLWSPATLRAFVLRHLGIGASYPRETNLRLEVPPSGADLHVSVAVEGRVPKEVFLQVRSGSRGEARAIAMAPRPGDRFRHVFRRVSGEFTFHADGGDDHQGDRTVTVRTVSPPQVLNIAATVHPPAYTGTTALEQRGGAIEALIGSDVDVAVATSAPVRSATMVFLESGRRLDLTAATPQDDGGVAHLYRTRFAVAGADRYQIELVGTNGLRNPDPGTYPIAALQDYAPIGRWLLPDDEGALLLPTALLCVRLDAHDDFGLAGIDLAVGTGDQPTVTRSLLPSAEKAPTAVLRTELLEVKELLGGAKGNDGLLLQAVLRDNKQPQAGSTELPRRIVQVVDEAQLNSAIARAFRGLREDASQALDLESDRRAHLEDLLANSALPAADLAQRLTGIEVGHSRVASALERVHRGLMRAFDLHLWNRLETSQHAPRVIELYLEHANQLAEPLAVDPAFYRDLALRRAAGSLGALERCLDRILAMLTLADEAARGPAAEVARALAEALVARGADDRKPLLQRAIAGQQRIEAALKQLLLQLQDWNDYQDLIQDARALRDSQRDLQDRTETLRGKK